MTNDSAGHTVDHGDLPDVPAAGGTATVTVDDVTEASRRIGQGRGHAGSINPKW